jgi:hypothetical protein
MTRFKTRITLAALLALTSLVGAAGAAAAVAPPTTSTPSLERAEAPGLAEVNPPAAAAMASQKGISVAEARAQLARQQSQGDLGAQIEKSLAGRSGGSYLDADGNLVVTTLDSASDAVVARSGARARRVDDSSARLNAIMKQLDRHAFEGHAGGAQGWYVDVPTNTVVVTITEGALDAGTAAITKLANTFGDSVRIEYQPAEEAPQAAAEYLVGGNEFIQTDGAHTCSVGFNTLDNQNRNVVLTAGHCVRTTGWVSRSGYWLGAVRSANFPGDDFGTFWNAYPSFWVPSTSVNFYNGTYGTVVGSWDNPPVGATVCKSGRTTGFTCGTITAVNETVRFDDGNVIYGLVRHNACVEGGDSGGANISAYFYTGYYALGVTSGARTRYERCLGTFGEPNVSWYQPIGEALTANGLRLVR